MEIIHLKSERNGYGNIILVSSKCPFGVSGHEFKVRPLIRVLCFSLVMFICTVAGME